MKYLFSYKSVYFPKQITLIREDLKMSYSDFATMCDLSKATVIRMEIERSGDFIKKRTWNKINLALNKMKYFEKDILPHIEIKNKITYARDDQTILKIDLSNTSTNVINKNLCHPIQSHLQYIN